MGIDRIINPDRCHENPHDKGIAAELDWARAKFISKRRLFLETGSTYLGFGWIILDPLILSVVYLFVFTVIRHDEDPTALFIGLGMIRGMQRSLSSMSNPQMDLKGGLNIDRVSTRAVGLSLVLYLVITTLLSGLGVAAVLLFLGAPILGALVFIAALLANNLFWYGVGLNALSLTTKMPDLHKVTSYFGTGMFFFSPVLFTIEATSGWHRTASIYNPLSYFLEVSRKVAIGEDYRGLDILPEIGFLALLSVMAVMIWRGNKRLDGIRWRMSNRS